MTQNVDVLICGSGSAGLCAAAWLSRYGVSFRILERRAGPLLVGKADGVQTRTVEIFDSFDIGQQLLAESYHVMELAFWNAEGEPRDEIRRSHFAPDKEPGISHRPHVILNQARMNDLLLSRLKDPSVIEYGCEVESVSLDGEAGPDGTSYVRVKTLHNGEPKTWQAKYVLGCDGAHSAIRRSLGFKMVGDSTDSVWGVMDIYCQTDFPDIRKKTVILSSSGNLLIIPREGDYLVRFYLELPAGTKQGDVSLEDLQQMARRIFQPYDMTFAETVWWSVYMIGQRLADNFHLDHRVFLTGDACHTHSPKAGQGMNVSLQDGYNIGWKLGAVLTGQAKPALLETYVSERQRTADELIRFDSHFTKLFSTKYRAEHGISAEHFAEQFVKAGRYTAGQGVHYEPSIIVAAAADQATPPIAQGLTEGTRFPNAQVVRHSDAKTFQLLDTLKSDRRWRLFVFAGDVSNLEAKSRLDAASKTLRTIVQRFTPSIADFDSVIEAILVWRGKRTEITEQYIPELFTPIIGTWKIKCLHKVYVDDESYELGHGHAFDTYGVDPANDGVIVLVRPDQYIAKICPFKEAVSLGDFFSGFLYDTE